VGSVCYGFFPLKVEGPLSELMSMVHGIDERISIGNLVFSVGVLYHLVRRLLT